MSEREPIRVGPQELIDDQLLENVPKLRGGKEHLQDLWALVRFFTRDSNSNWYVCEYDGEDTFFGIIVDETIQLSFFSLAGLKQHRGPMGMPVERDTAFRPTPVSDLIRYHMQRDASDQEPSA